MYSDIKLNDGGIVGRFFTFLRPGHCSPAGVYNVQIKKSETFCLRKRNELRKKEYRK